MDQNKECQSIYSVIPIRSGPTSIDVTDEQPSTVEAPPADQQEEKVQQQKQTNRAGTREIHLVQKPLLARM